VNLLLRFSTRTFGGWQAGLGGMRPTRVQVHDR
jgi:hypothetical protein